MWRNRVGSSPRRPTLLMEPPRSKSLLNNDSSFIYLLIKIGIQKIRSFGHPSISKAQGQFFFLKDLALHSQSARFSRTARQSLHSAESIPGVKDLPPTSAFSLLELFLYLAPDYQFSSLLALLCFFAETGNELYPLLLALLAGRLFLIPGLPPGWLLQ